MYTYIFPTPQSSSAIQLAPAEYRIEYPHVLICALNEVEPTLPTDTASLRLLPAAQSILFSPTTIRGGLRPARPPPLFILTTWLVSLIGRSGACTMSVVKRPGEMPRVAVWISDPRAISFV